jgi:DNA polymerase-3 subunit delta'
MEITFLLRFSRHRFASRPLYLRMQFKDVIGLDEVKQHLAELVEHNRLSHALLFLGKEGYGALPLAIAFAQYIVSLPTPSNVVAPGLFGAPAEPENIFIPPEKINSQPSWQRANELVHPDLHFSYPVIPRKPGDKPVSTDYIVEWREFIQSTPYGNIYDWLQFIGAENKQGNITANECSDIIRKLNLKTFESEYKVLVMWMPEYLGNEGNKLLKQIEEPPPNTLFILVAENESLILPTILSRTQLIKIPALSTEEIATALESQARITAEQARQIASVSEGNYREALQLASHAEEDWQGLLRNWLNTIMKTGPASQVKWIEETSKMGREKQKQFLRYFSHLLEQAIRLETMGEFNITIPDNERDFALRLNKIAGLAQQQAVIKELDNAIYYIERNANARLLFHSLTIKIYHIIANQSIIEVL